MTDFASAWWRHEGFTVGVDWPYGETIVPLNRLNQDPRVRSMMVEINRRLYMRLNGNTAERSADFERLRALLTELLNDLVAADLSVPMI